jgi:hypothetical protein
MIIINSVEQNPSLEASNYSAAKKCLSFMKTKGSLSSSKKKSINGPYRKQDKSNPHPRNYFFNIYLQTVLQSTPTSSFQVYRLKVCIRFSHASCILHVHSLSLPSSSNLNLCSSHTARDYVAHPAGKLATSRL